MIQMNMLHRISTRNLQINRLMNGLVTSCHQLSVCCRASSQCPMCSPPRVVSPAEAIHRPLLFSRPRRGLQSIKIEESSGNLHYKPQIPRSRAAPARLLPPSRQTRAIVGFRLLTSLGTGERVFLTIPSKTHKSRPTVHQYTP